MFGFRDFFSDTNRRYNFGLNDYEHLQCHQDKEDKEFRATEEYDKPKNQNLLYFPKQISQYPASNNLATP